MTSIPTGLNHQTNRFFKLFKIDVDVAERPEPPFPQTPQLPAQLPPDARAHIYIQRTKVLEGVNFASIADWPAAEDIDDGDHEKRNKKKGMKR